MKNLIRFSNYINHKYYNKIYNLYINKLINNYLKKGNKFRSQKFFFLLKYYLKKNSKIDCNFILLLSLIKAILKIFFIKKRFGKVYKDIPMPLLNERSIRFVIKDYFKYSYSNRTRNIDINNLNNLIFNTSKGKGKIIEKNYKVYKKAVDARI